MGCLSAADAAERHFTLHNNSYAFFLKSIATLHNNSYFWYYQQLCDGHQSSGLRHGFYPCH
jgi:hypothetical protein